MSLSVSMDIAAAAMRAQGTRIRVAAENLANAQSTGDGPGDTPYRRQVVTFNSLLDRTTGAHMVEIGQIAEAPGEFERRYEPQHPSADADGYVLYPNVNPMVETMDIREAQRSYEANMNVLETARSMLTSTLDLLRR
ncbi:MAG: flagellar basal body rod protein FlgC [Rhodospirillaceae bacterium]|nr:flagellar basal body rod protein FlgC [Rhodospirillaceae bacterium]